MLENLDRRDGRVYVFASDDDPLHLAADVAIATDRPLLLRGWPGVVSSLAAYIAHERSWRYYEHTVTARTDATDLMWTFDAVRKLGDAMQIGTGQVKPTLLDHDYVRPGVLWWAFNPDSAEARGCDGVPVRPAAEPGEHNEGRGDEGAVVLIDEIDKADPDVPNALLSALGSRTFDVTDTDTHVKQQRRKVLVVITTNEERMLPPAFLRRCVVHVVQPPTSDHMERIAVQHSITQGRPFTPDQLAVVKKVAGLTESLQKAAHEQKKRPPGVAEFLDTVWAAVELEITVDDDRLEFVKKLTLTKDVDFL